MADALERHQTGIAKIPAQRLGGSKINGAVFRSPDEERGVIANLGERPFQFREVCRPILYDVRGMTEHVILEYGHAVALRANRVEFLLRRRTDGAAIGSRGSASASIVLRKSMEPKGLPRKGASRLPCGDQGLTGATSTRRCRRASLFCRRSAQIAATMMATPPPWEVPSRSKSLDAERVRELQDAFGGGAYGAVHALVRRREPGAQIVDGIDGRMGRERGDGESPGKGIAHQPMNQDERRAGPGLEVAHAPVGEIEPVLFNLHVRCNSKRHRAGLVLALGGGDEFFFGILRFGGQRNPRRQGLTK